MRVVIQRVSEACVKVNDAITGEIKAGLLVLIGIEDADSNDDITWLAGKIVNLRIFNDQDGVMNKSVIEVDGTILLVSQFTLHVEDSQINNFTSKHKKR